MARWFMNDVICMASDVFSRGCHERCEECHQFVHRPRASVVSGRDTRTWTKRLPTLVVHTQPNFCLCSHPYLRFAATLGFKVPPTVMSRQADLSHALDDIKATINKQNLEEQYVTIFDATVNRIKAAVMQSERPEALQYGWCKNNSASKLS